MSISFKTFLFSLTISYFTSFQLGKCQGTRLQNTVICGYLDSSFKKAILQGTNYGSFVIFTDYKSYFNVNKTDSILENGFFKFNLDITNPIYITINGTPASPFSAFKVGDKRFFTGTMLIEPGDSICIDARENKIDYTSIEFSGKGVEKHWCIQSLIKNTEMYHYNGSSEKSLKNYELRDSIKNMLLQTIEVFKPKMSKSAYNILKSHYVPMLSFDVSEIVLKTKMNLLDSGNREFYYSQVGKNYVDIYDSSLLYSDPYFTDLIRNRAFIQYSIEKSVSTDFIYTPFSFLHYLILKNYIPDMPAKARVISNYLQRAVVRTGLTPSVDSALKDFIEFYRSSNEIYSKGISQISLDTKKRLGQAKNAYQFSLRDTSGFVHKMSDFKGKIVLLDFMFNACPGCVQLAPYVEKIENKYIDNENVVFVAISIDKTMKDWKKGIGRSSSKKALQLYTNSLGNQHPVLTYYNIVSFPTLVLIDKDGSVISLPAPDPRKDNGKNLEKLINSLLLKSKTAYFRH
jgi:thiol-disulfide isomerase/thioredoxin